jgi:hypothetical protein
MKTEPLFSSCAFIDSSQLRFQARSGGCHFIFILVAYSARDGTSDIVLGIFLFLSYLSRRCEEQWLGTTGAATGEQTDSRNSLLANSTQIFCAVTSHCAFYAPITDSLHRYA